MKLTKLSQLEKWIHNQKGLDLDKPAIYPEKMTRRYMIRLALVELERAIKDMEDNKRKNKDSPLMELILPEI